MGLNRKKTPSEKGSEAAVRARGKATGEGPDEAVVSGWPYKGKFRSNPNGTGEFEFTDRSGNQKTTHRFTLRKPK